MLPRTCKRHFSTLSQTEGIDSKNLVDLSERVSAAISYLTWFCRCFDWNKRAVRHLGRKLSIRAKNISGMQCLLKDTRWLMGRYFTTVDAVLPFNYGITKNYGGCRSHLHVNSHYIANVLHFATRGTNVAQIWFFILCLLN